MSNQNFNVKSEKCPSRNVLEAISDKWSILIMTILSKKTCRFGELKREIGGISPKMLTQTLLKLERLGFIVKLVFPVLPMRVEYSLSLLGKDLSRILNSLTSWTENNMSAILSAEISFVEKDQQV